MASSFLHILALPLFLFLSTEAAATTIQDACSKTQHAQLCVDSLLTFPESQNADLHKLAALAIRFAANNGVETQFVTAGVVQDVANNSVLAECLRDCVEHFQDGVEQLDTSTGALDEKSYDDVKLFVNAALMDATSCNEGCEEAKEEPEAVEMKKKTDHFHDLCSIALALTSSLVK